MLPRSPTRLSAQTAQWLESLDVFTSLIANFRRHTGARIREWEEQGGNNSLVIELAAVLSEADSLSRLVDSIVDGTEEKVPMPELRERFVKLMVKADVLLGRWKTRGLGFGY